MPDIHGRPLFDHDKLRSILVQKLLSLFQSCEVTSPLLLDLLGIWKSYVIQQGIHHIILPIKGIKILVEVKSRVSQVLGELVELPLNLIHVLDFMFKLKLKS